MRGLITLLLVTAGCVGDAAVPTTTPDAAGADASGTDAGGTDAQNAVDGAVTTMTIPTLRDPAAVGHPARGAKVTIASAIVTGVKNTGASRGFFIQDAAAKEWAGVFVLVGTVDPTVGVGATVTVTGFVTAFRGFEQLDVSSGRGTYAAIGSATLPAPLDVTPSDIRAGSPTADKYQSMILRVKAVKAKSAVSGVDFVVTSAAGNDDLIVTSYIANDSGPAPWQPTVNQSYSSITGRGYKSGSTDQNAVAKLAPLGVADLVP